MQAGALTRALDRLLPTDHPELRDYARSEGFSGLAAELGTSAAALARRYALSLPIDTMVLGAKNPGSWPNASTPRRARCRQI